MAATAAVGLLWGTGAPPDPGAWLAVTALTVLASGGIITTTTATVAAVAGFGSLVDSGAWTGLKSCGIPGRRLAPGALAIGALAGLITLGFEVHVSPAARRQIHRTLDLGLAAARPWPGAVIELGDLAVRADHVDEQGVAHNVFLATDSAVGSARRAQLVTAEGTVSVVLEDGVLSGPDADLAWVQWVRPLPSRGTRRLALGERSNAELLTVAKKTADSGKNASYERAVYLKRFLQPLAAAFLPIAFLPAAVHGRRWLKIGALCIGYVAAARLGDHVATEIGATASALTGCAYASAVGCWLWLRWSDR